MHVWRVNVITCRRFELFFDLLFVGLIHQIAESTAEQPTAVGLAKYVLTYCPAFSVWSDARELGNMFSTDDVSQVSEQMSIDEDLTTEPVFWSGSSESIDRLYTA